MNEVWDSLYDAFASIPDPRVERTKRHSLIDIISIAICAEEDVVLTLGLRSKYSAKPNKPG